MIKCPNSENKFGIIHSNIFNTQQRCHLFEQNDVENQTICFADNDSVENVLHLNGDGFDATSLIVEINSEA